jgi:acyl carrier protein
MDSLPDGVTVAGNPARIIRDREAAGAASPAIRTGAKGPPPDATVLRLVAVIERSVDVRSAANAIGKDTVLLGDGIGLDSLEILRLINEVEEEFGLTVDESQLKPSHLRTVASLASFIEEQMGS